MLLAGVAGFIQNPVGLTGRQPLVPQVNRQSGQLAQFGGEGLRLCGLRAHFAGEMQWLPTTMPDHAKPPASRASERRSSRGLRRRSSVRTGCAVSPSSSDTATPMRRLPMSRAR